MSLIRLGDHNWSYADMHIIHHIDSLSVNVFNLLYENVISVVHRITSYIQPTD